MNIPPVTAQFPSVETRDQQLQRVAVEFEATFLSEMLKNTGLTGIEGGFSGGVGEEAFSGMLTQKYAAAMADAGGIGLAEWVYKSLVQKDGQ